MITPLSKVKIDFDEASHQYTIDGEIKPSVTQLLNICNIIKDISTLPVVHRRNIERAGRIGRTVHAWTEIVDKNQEDLFDEPTAQILTYIRAWKQFIKNISPKFIESERPHYCEYGDYCGTPDRVATIKNNLYIIDIKTARKINPAAKLQTMGYSYFFKEPCKRMVVQLCPDGQYKVYDDGEIGSKYMNDEEDKKLWEAVIMVTKHIRGANE